MVERQLSVLIADDHPATRAGIRASLEVNGFRVCGEVGDAKAAVEVALNERPDICLLDVHMPGNGIAAASRILRSISPVTRTIPPTACRSWPPPEA